jgi:hypothetical protein
VFNGGGGGLGAGGDIFIQQGAKLVIQSGSLAAGSVIGGSGASGASGGQGLGGGVFIQGNQQLTLSPGFGQTETIAGVIADQSGSGGSGPGAGAGTLAVGGSGRVVLGAANTYVGGTTLGDAAELEIGADASAGSGTIAFTTIHGTLVVDGGAAPGNIISGFVQGDTIDLNGIAWQSGDAPSYTVASGELDIVRGSTKLASLFFGAGNSAVDHFIVSQALPGTGIQLTEGPPCYVTGTRIRTTAGDTPVEALRPGDLVLTEEGDPRPVRWIGYRAIDLRRHAAPELVRPIRIRAGAIAAGVPARDLLVSPDHAMFLHGALVPARQLVNHASILFDTSLQRFTYYHVELDRHAVLYAESAPSESYLDTGNRAMFSNGGAAVRLHPEFGTGQAARVAGSCAPLLTMPAEVLPMWRELAERAVRCGWSLPRPDTVTRDPALVLIREGLRVAPVSVNGSRHKFVVPPGQGDIRLVSRAARPSDHEPWLGDRRLLGVKVRRMTWGNDIDAREFPLDDPALRGGWWAVEDDGAGPLRWTDGAALLPPMSAGILTVHIAATLTYRADRVLGGASGRWRRGFGAKAAAAG